MLAVRLRPQGALLVVLCLSGCAGAATLASVSAGHIGCSPNEIKIANDKAEWGLRTWTAECRGRTHQCSAVALGESGQVSCKAMVVSTGQGLAVNAGHGRIELPSEGARLSLLADIQDSFASTTLEFAATVSQVVLSDSEKKPQYDENGRLMRDANGDIAFVSTAAPRKSKLADCKDVRVVVDGNAIPLGEPSYTSDAQEERLRVPLNQQSLEAIRTGTRTVGSLCGDRFTLLEGAKPAIDALLLRMREEIALEQPAPAVSSGGETHDKKPPAAAETQSTQL